MKVINFLDRFLHQLIWDNNYILWHSLYYFCSISSYEINFKFYNVLCDYL